MPFLAVSFDLEEIDADRAEAICFACGALAVTFSDARDEAVLEPAPGEIRLWPNTRAQALFDGATAAPALRAALASALPLEPARLALSVLADRVWEREWLRDFHAMRFGERLWICPQHEQVADPEAIVVRLDPGMAFGTGTHASTALCLNWLDAHAPAGQQVIDYGCGSGILGVAAAKLGARQVQSYDIDPQALVATAQNAAANGVADRLIVCPLPATLSPGCDLLLANILANTLAALSATFAALVRPGGQILLAGILAPQCNAVTAAFAPWFDMALCAEREEWVALAGRRHHHVHRLP